MRIIYPFLILLFCLPSLTGRAAWGVLKTGVSVNGVFHDCQWISAAPDFNGGYLGRFNPGDALNVNYAEILTFKNGASNVCQPTMYYRVYRTCDPAPAFTAYAVTYCCDQGGMNCPAAGGGLCGPDVNNPGDQKWWANAPAVNWLNGLSSFGSYVVEIYFEIPGDDVNPAGCGSPSQLSNNGGNNFRAYFELGNTDSFSDGNLTGPAWAGDNANFTIVNKSDAAALNGTEANNSYSLRSNGPAAIGIQHLSTAITTWDSQQEWYFWMGRRSTAATTADATTIWLYANESNLESATVDGYRIVFGDNAGIDEFRLQVVTNNVGTDIFITAAGVPNGLTDYGVAFIVKRNTSGSWTIKTSAMPTVNGTGASAISCVESVATLLNTNILNASTSATNTLYTPSGTGYVGVIATHTAGGAVAQEFDNFYVRTLPPDTQINFSPAAATVDENLGGGTHTISVTIQDPSPTAATTVEVALVTGDAARVDNYTTQTLTFPAGSSAPQNVVVTVTDNTVCDGTEVLTFQLQNPSGGNSAVIGTAGTHTLTIVDDNTGYETLLSENFDDGNLTSPTWTPVGGSTWTASTANAISGSHSMRHTFTGSSGTAYSYADLDNGLLTGVETIWRFNLRTFLTEPSNSTRWQVYLATNEPNLQGTTVDGYAVGVFPVNGTVPDVLTLWRVVNGVLSVPVIAADPSDAIYDWGSAQDIVGFEVVRTAAGEWTLRVDANGGFDNLSTIGSATDATYPELNYFGIRYQHSGTNGGKMSIDDISVSQQGCRDTYYSRDNGNFTDAIWSLQPTGLPAPAALEPGRWTSLEVQASHTVTMDTDVVCNNFTIEGAVNGGGSSHEVYGNWNNSGGTYSANSSTVLLKGADAPGQEVGGTSTTRFHNLSVRNEFGVVNLNAPTEITGVLLPIEGTIETNGNLTLISNSTLSGSIGEISAGAAVSGDVTLQRHIPAGNAGWVFLGCPLTGQTINGAWNDDIITTGFAGSDFPPPGYTFINIFSYDESQMGDLDVGWTGATNATNVLSSSYGYNVYLNSSAQNIDVTGPIQFGNIGVPALYTDTGDAGDGWNLMTNVYPSEIDWVALEDNSDDFGAYYVYDAALPGYRSFNANTEAGTASQYIAHSQSFFVKADGTGQNLDFREAHKTSTNAGYVRSSEDSRMMAFRLERNGLADEAVLAFIDGATDAYEQSYDAEKWTSPVAEAPEFAFVSSDNVLMTIDARPLITDGTSIPVSLDLPEAGTYTFIVQEVLNMQAGVCMTIEDVVTGETIAAQAGTELAVVVSAPYVGQRLIIHFSPAAQIAATHATCFGSADGSITLAASSGTWNYALVNEGGTIVSAGSSLADIGDLTAGFYSLELANQEAGCGAEDISITIEQPVQATAWSSSGKATCSAASDGWLEFGISSGESYSYSVTLADGTVVANGESSEMTFTLENLTGDVYIIGVTTGCDVFMMEENLRDPQAVEATVVASANEAEMVAGTSVDVAFEADAPGAETYSWTISGNEAGTAPAFTHTFTQGGTYPVVLVASNSSCSDEASAQVVVNEVVGVAEATPHEPVSLVQTNGGISLTFHGINARRAEIRFINTLGQIAQTEQAAPSDGQRIFIAMDQMASGVYTVQVLADGSEVFACQVVKH